MKGLARLIIACLLGALAMCWLPRAGVLAATQEIIAFLALLMAGLLPAMILTATILRSGGFSARRVQEYGGALQLQLRFWAFLFAAAGIATIGVVGTKIFSTQTVVFEISYHTWKIDQNDVTTFCVIIAGAGLGIVLQRLRPAYLGLVSLLQLNVNIAKTEAIAQDRSLRSRIEREADSASPQIHILPLRPRPNKATRRFNSRPVYHLSEFAFSSVFR